MEKETMVATVPQAEIVDEQQLSRDVTDIEFQAESLVIQTNEDYAFAGEFGKMLKKKASQVTTFFKPMKDSAYQAHKAVCDREKAMLTPLRNAEKTVKQVMSAYIAEQERKRREAEEAARRAAEAERERKIQEAATLEAAGDADGAEAAFEEAAIMDDAASYAVVPAAATPKVSGVSTSKDWEIVEIDPKAVPLAVAGIELRPVDQAAVTHVELDLDFVKKYLVRGRAELVSNQELVFFMNTCRQQKLNPLVQGEVYLIKYSKDDPAQMVVGKDAYLRRAFDHPDYLFKNDGITVQRGNEIIQKEGCCLYPGETLVGGWCRVTFMRNGKERTAFKEVAFAEYNKGKANWNSKPATMINKVAVSQCVRDAFPKDYEGVYSEDEMIASGAIPVDYKELDDQKPEEQPAEEEDPVISQEQRQQLFKAAQANFGKDKGNAVVKSIIEEMGLTSTTGMKMSTYNKVVERLVEICTAHKAELEAEEGTKNDGAAEE